MKAMNSRYDWGPHAAVDDPSGRLEFYATGANAGYPLNSSLPNGPLATPLTPARE